MFSRFTSALVPAFAASLVASSLSFAGAGSGGGGDAIILPNDRVVLADPFLDTSAPQPNNMPPLRALNPRILQLAGLYADVASPLLRGLSPLKNASDVENEIRKLSKRALSPKKSENSSDNSESDLRFYAVQSQNELNNFCAPGGRKTYKLPEGYSVMQIACTAGNETYLVEPLFIRLSLRDQVLLLIHERLTTLRDQYGGKNYSAIARITSGLSTFLDVYQEQSKAIYRQLKDAETQRLSDLYIAIEELQYRDKNPDSDSFQWHAHPNGGGRVHNGASVDDSAFVSLDVVVSKNMKLAAQVKLIHASFQYSDTTPKTIQIGENSIIQNSTVCTANELSIGSRVSMIDSQMFAHSWIEVRDDVTVRGSELVSQAGPLWMDAGTSISGSKIVVSVLKIGKDQHLENGSMTNESLRYLPVGEPRPAPISLTWTSGQLIEVQAKDETSALANGAWILNAQGIDGSMRIKDSKLALFGPKKYVLETTLKVELKPEENQDPNTYTIVDGKIAKAGFQRTGKITFNNWGNYYPTLTSEIKNQLVAAHLKYDYLKRFTSYVDVYGADFLIEFPR